MGREYLWDQILEQYELVAKLSPLNTVLFNLCHSYDARGPMAAIFSGLLTIYTQLC